jgi:hypothetical protein
MGAVRHKRDWGVATLFTLAVFTSVSFSKFWSTWYFSSDVGLRFPATFWTMLKAFPRVADEVGVRSLVFNYYGPEMVKLTALLGLSLVVGRWVGRRLNRWAELADRTSKEGPDPVKRVGVGYTERDR